MSRDHSVPGARGATVATDEWLTDFIASYCKHRPVNATFVGLHDRDHLLPDFSEHGTGDTLADMQRLLRLSPDDDRSGLTGAAEAGDGIASEPAVEDGYDRVLARGFLRIQQWEYQSTHFQRGNPVTYTGEAVFGVLSLFLTPFAPLAERVECAIERMEAVPAFLAQARENVKCAPQSWTDRAMRECMGALAFLNEGVALLAAGERITEPRFKAAAERAAAAFAAFQLHLESELRNQPSDRHACGEEALDLYLREGHFVDIQADEIVRRAEAGLTDATRYLEDHAADFGASGSRAALRGLADVHPPLKRYYERYRETWEQVRELAERLDLVTWPDEPVHFVPRPAWARKAAPFLYFLFYRSPAAFNRPPVHEHLVTPIDADMPAALQRELLMQTNDSVIRLNHVIHHAGIGHHVQNWHAYRSPSLVGRLAAVDCASRIAMFCGGTMAEGWACYATDLVSEAGFLTPLEQYAERQARARMCARAIVDIRLHQGRMTIEQAARFYERHAGMDRGPAFNEAVRNSMFPGTAAMYMLGRDEIHRLRSEFSARRGPRFSLRSFHDELLAHGSVPVTLIGRDMMRKAADAA